MSETAHLQSLTPDPHLDDKAMWPFLEGRPPFDTLAFQAELDKIGGQYDGHSWYRLVWCADPLLYVDGEWLPRYGVFMHDGRVVTPPRWYIEHWQHPASMEAGWQRYMDNGQGHITDFGELPREGEYHPIHAIEEHDPGKACCCRIDSTCYGYYRRPDESDLDWVRRDFRARCDAPYQDPRAGVTMEDLERARRYQNELEEQRDAESAAYKHEAATEIAKYYGRKREWSKNVTPGAWRKTDAGLIVPAR